MPGNASQKPPMDEGETSSFRKKKKTAIGVGVLLSLGIMALGGWLFRFFTAPPPVPTVSERNVVGIVDFQEAIKAHKEYTRLLELRQECKALREEVASLVPLPQVNPPEVDGKPFEDSVWQKNAQNIIGRRAELERQQKKAAAEYRAMTETDYSTRKEEIDGRYLNAITNLRLKLDNADVLRLGQEAIARIADQLDRLQKERGEAQSALREEWEADIEQHAKQSIAKELEELRLQATETKGQFETEAMRRQSEAQARDVQAMEARMTAVQRFQKATEKRQELADREQELLSLESHMFNDVAGKAAKLAIQHHFIMVLANPATRLESLLPWPERVGPRPERNAKVIASGAVDLTEELVAELK